MIKHPVDSDSAPSNSVSSGDQSNMSVEMGDEMKVDSGHISISEVMDGQDQVDPSQEESQPDVPISQEVPEDAYIDALEEPVIRFNERLVQQRVDQARVMERVDTQHATGALEGTNLNISNSFVVLDDDDIKSRALELGIHVDSLSLDTIHALKDLEIARHNLALKKTVPVDEPMLVAEGQIVILDWKNDHETEK